MRQRGNGMAELAQKAWQQKGNPLANTEPYPGGAVEGNKANFAPDYPIFSQFGKTGATRYTPRVAGDKYGRVFIYYPDTITIQEYDEMRFDGQVRAGLMLVKLPVQRASWEILCDDPDVQAFVQEVLKPIWSDLIRQVLLGLDFGFSVFEKIWELTYGLTVTQTQAQAQSARERTYPTAVTLKRLMHLDPMMIYLLAYEKSGQFAGVEQFAPSTVIIPKEKSFIFSHDREFDEHHGISRLRPAYPYWYFKKLEYEWMMVDQETYAVPMKEGRYPPGRIEVGVDADGQPIYDTNMEHMLELLEEMRNNHAIALPSDVDESGNPKWGIEFKETGRQPGNGHIEVLDHLNLMILKSLLVPQLALETGSSGTYNLAQEQINFFKLGEEGLMEQVAWAFNNDLIPQLVRYNFGPRAPRALLKFAPLYGDIMEQVAGTLIQTIGQDQPIPLLDGSYMMPDWQRVAEISGIPVQVLKQEDALALQRNRAQYESEYQSMLPQQPGAEDGQGQDTGAGGGQGQPGPGQGPGVASQGGLGAGGGQQPGTGGDYNLVELAEEAGRWQYEEGELVWTPLVA